jgi:hypothetical protein
MEDIPSISGVNGSYYHTDIPMDVDTTPVITSGAQVFSGMCDGGAPTLHISPTDDEEETKPPPAKRRRVHSSADQASLAHVSIFSLLFHNRRSPR